MENVLYFASVGLIVLISLYAILKIDNTVAESCTHLIFTAEKS